MKPLCGSLKLQPFHSTLCYPQQLTGVGTIDKWIRQTIRKIMILLIFYSFIPKNNLETKNCHLWIIQIGIMQNPS
jgi:hypothetical protein